MKHTAESFFFTWCILTLLQETVALQMDVHQLIEITQKSKKHTWSTQLFVHICSVCNTGCITLAYILPLCPLIPNCTHFLFVSQNKPALAKRKQGAEEDPVWPTRRKQVSSSDLIATWREPINTCIDDFCTRYSTKRFPQSSLMCAKVRINYRVPCSEVSAAVLHRCHGLLLQIHSSKRG